jgi:hypothetical protein
MAKTTRSNIFRPSTDPYGDGAGVKYPQTHKPTGSPAASQTGLLTGNQSGRAPSDKAMASATRGVPLNQVGNNPTVHSKNQRRYGTDGSKGPQGSTGHSPTKPYASSPTDHTPTPVRHVTPAAPKEARAVGYVNGKFIEPRYK